MSEDETVENAKTKNVTEKVAEVNPLKAEAKLEKNKNLLVGYQAELDALGENPVRKGQLENKIADLKKQIKG